MLVQQVKLLSNKMRALLTIILCFAAKIIFAQSVEIDRIDIRGNKIIVWYNLNDPNLSHKYFINLYSSKDKFKSPLVHVSGDVGLEVAPGNEKKITWDITNELGNYKGSIKLEIRGSVAAPFIYLKNASIRKSYKRGKEYPITWASGNMSGQINIELYKANELVWGIINLPNSGKFYWTVPKNLKKGENYTLKFINAKDPNEYLYSTTFEIKPRTPLVLKAGAIVVLGAGAALLGGGSKGGGSSPTTTDLPNPPSTPN